MAVTTTVINFPAPNPASGTVSAMGVYNRTGVGTAPGTYEFSWLQNLNEVSFSQSTQSATLSSLGFTQGAQIISVIPHATIPANHRIYFQSEIFMSPVNSEALRTKLAEIMANGVNRTLSMSYSASVAVPRTVEAATAAYQYSKNYSGTYNFTATSLTVVWAPAGEEIPEAEDPIHENTDSNALFVINPYGPVKEAHGVGIGGWPTGDADNPTMDCFIKTVFKNPLVIADTATITQTPVWKDTYGMLQNNYTYRMVNNEIYGAPQFCRINGTVYVRGYVTRDGLSGDSLIFTLPEGYTPSQELIKFCYYQNGTSQANYKGFAIIKVQTDGQVILVSARPWSVGGIAMSSSYSFINLDFSFRL